VDLPIRQTDSLADRGLCLWNTVYPFVLAIAAQYEQAPVRQRVGVHFIAPPMFQDQLADRTE
jgi:hypothetical protein